MGRTIRRQVALYLDAEKAEALKRLSEQSGRTQQELLREAVDRLIEERMKRRPARRLP